MLKPTLVPSPGAAKSGGASDSEGGKKNKEVGEGTVDLVPSSRKDASVRRRELLAYLREPLREACACNAGELMRSKSAGALVLLEAVRVFKLLFFSHDIYCCACLCALYSVLGAVFSCVLCYGRFRVRICLRCRPEVCMRLSFRSLLVVCVLAGGVLWGEGRVCVGLVFGWCVSTFLRVWCNGFALFCAFFAP